MQNRQSKNSQEKAPRLWFWPTRADQVSPTSFRFNSMQSSWARFSADRWSTWMMCSTKERSRPFENLKKAKFWFWIMFEPIRARGRKALRKTIRKQSSCRIWLPWQIFSLMMPLQQLIGRMSQSLDSQLFCQALLDASWKGKLKPWKKCQMHLKSHVSMFWVAPRQTTRWESHSTFWRITLRITYWLEALQVTFF